MVMRCAMINGTVRRDWFGPRICPGRNLALLEMKLLLSVFYKNFEAERVSKTEDVREVFAFARSPAGPKVRLRRCSVSATTTTVA
jgi:cytochrome P450